MELSGADKRIRALFCELKREEERTSPLFATTWNIAEAEFHRVSFRRLCFQSPANLRRFATAVLIVSLVLAATVLLPKYLRQQPKHDYAKQAVATGSRATAEEPPRPGKVSANRESVKPNDRLLAIHRSVRVKKSSVAFAQQARPVNPVNQIKQDELSAWQSPTATLLRSAGAELLRTGPPMNESAEEMKKFLTNALN